MRYEHAAELKDRLELVVLQETKPEKKSISTEFNFVPLLVMPWAE